MNVIKRCLLVLAQQAGYIILTKADFSERQQRLANTTRQLAQAERQLTGLRQRLTGLRQRLRAATGARDLPSRDSDDTEIRSLESGAKRPPQRLPLVEELLTIIDPRARFLVLDGGAREAHRDPRWRALGSERLSIRGFEPDVAECERLNREAAALGRDYKYYAVGLWDEVGTFAFEDNMASGGSSFLRQNTVVTDRWKFENPHTISMAREMFRPARVIDVKTTSVERWASVNAIDDIDFAKLNVQGGELKILRAFGDKLSDVVGILVEVAFVESYVDRPFFADIDGFLRERGFTFFDIIAHHYVGRADSPITAQQMGWGEQQFSGQVSSMGQLIEGHALYLRDPIEMESRGLGTERFTTTKLLKLICIAEIFGQTEFCFELAKWLAARVRTRGDIALAGLLECARDRAAKAYEEIDLRETL